MARLIAAALLLGALTANAAASPENSPTTAASPTPPSSTEPVTPERHRLATRLLDLVHPDQVSIDANMRGWESGMRKMLAADPTFARLELDYPGISEAAVDGARPVALEFSREFVRNVKALKADVFAQRLTAAELQQAIAFFDTPVGQKFAKGMAETADPAAVLDNVRARAAAGGEDLTLTDLTSATRKTSRQVMSGMSSAEVLQIMRFESLPAARKFAAAGQESEALVLVKLKNVDPKWLERQQQAVAQAALRFAELKARK